MRILIELSGECKELAKAEALAVAGLHGPAAVIESSGRALVLESSTPPSEFISRLSLAWSVSEHLFSCSSAELDANLENVVLPGKTFRVRPSRLDDSIPPEDGRRLAQHAGTALSSRYAVNLGNPDSELRILMSGRYHAGSLSGEIDRPSFESRKSENRPFKHPISLHPKLARALVNLTRVGSRGTLLDPFCGTGGILLEAGLIGCRVLGGDIDRRMVDGTRLNLTHYRISHADVRETDISSWASEPATVGAIATDPPYGRSASTAKEPIASLYRRAFGACHSALEEGGRLAIVLPEEKYIRLAEGFTIEGVHPVRVHRSLTRYFCVFIK